MELKLFVDTYNRRLVTSATDESPFALPILYRQDSLTLTVTLLEPTGLLSAPFNIVDITDLTLKAGIGTPPDEMLTLQETWTKNTTAGVMSFSGQLPLDTQEILDEFVSKGTTLSKLLELETTEAGNRTTVLQNAITLNHDIIHDGSPTPTAWEPPSNLVTNLESILKDSTTIDVEKNGNEFKFTLQGIAVDGALTAGKIIQVKSDGTGFEFVDAPSGTGGSSGATDFTGLTDTPSSLTASKYVAVNSAGDALELVDLPPSGASSLDDLSDVQTSGTGHTPADGDVLKWSASMGHWMPDADNTGGGGGATAFTALTDTPGSLTADKFVRVNSAGDALEFADGTGSGSGATTFTALTDTPGSLTADKFVRVNSAGDALEFVDSTGSGATGPAGADGADGQNGSDGQGWTGGAYDAATGVITFSSNDGLGFATGDLRGATGPAGPEGPEGPAGPAGGGGSVTTPTSVDWVPTEVMTGIWRMEFDVAMGGASFQRIDNINGDTMINLDSIVAGASVSLVLRSVLEDEQTNDPTIQFPLTWPADWEWLSLRPDAIGIAETIVVAISCTDGTLGGVVAGAAPVNVGTDMSTVIGMNIDETTVNLP